MPFSHTKKIQPNANETQKKHVHRRNINYFSLKTIVIMREECARVQKSNVDVFTIFAYGKASALAC